MKDLLDVHMHTLASGHAYNTIREMIAAGSKKGLALVGIADHAPAMPGSTHRFYFENLRIFDREVYGKEAGVELLMGVELNILNTTGKVDLEEKALCSVDYAIASLHDPCINPGTELDNTTAIMSAMWIPQVKIIGHPDNPRFPVDFDKIAKAAAERHVLLECNNSSYRPAAAAPARATSPRRCCRPARSTARTSSWAAMRTSTSMSAIMRSRKKSSARPISRKNSSSTARRRNSRNGSAPDAAHRLHIATSSLCHIDGGFFLTYNSNVVNLIYHAALMYCRQKREW